MALREDLLNEIPGENPSGQDLRYQPIYDQVREARREDDDLAQGVWAQERKVADFALVKKLTQQAIATQSKDLQLAAWLTEALLKQDGFAGFTQGLDVCRGLLDKFSDTLYPLPEDGDAELRAAPLYWVASKFEPFVRSVPLNSAGHGFYPYNEAIAVVKYETQATSDADKKKREKLLNEGKLAPEAFDKAVAQTPKKFYADADRDLDESLKALKALDAVCQDKFSDAAPTFGKLQTAVEEVRRVVHGLLEKKREVEPDPVEAPPAVESAAAPLDGAETSEGMVVRAQGAVAGGPATISIEYAAEPPDRREAIASIVEAARFLRNKEPHSPAPYLLLRGLRWGELRAAVAASDSKIMEAPPTGMRQEIKRLALDRKWNELLNLSESIMGLPCSRAWLDLQRFVVEACVALGPEYNAISVAIRSELRALIRDIPDLLDAKLMDDTAVANSETQAWLRGLLDEPANAAPNVNPVPGPVMDNNHAPGWQKSFIDSYALATEALRAGQEQKAFELLFREIERQRSGRGRFQRRLELVLLCMAAGKDAIAQPILDDLTSAIETHKLEDWEDSAMIASALSTILRCSKRVQADAKEKQKLFERICRLDPVQALAC
jgi:type VI secretion system protein ImpA